MLWNMNRYLAVLLCCNKSHFKDFTTEISCWLVVIKI